MPLFDKFARTYEEGHAKAVAITGFKPSYLHAYKVREVARYLASQGLLERPRAMLNYGCGTGSSEPYIRREMPGVTVCGVDVSLESIKVAREANKSLEGVSFEGIVDGNLPLGRVFDFAFIANVFHHVRREQHVDILRDIHSALLPGGLVFMFEFNLLNPFTLLIAILNDYRVDKEARMLMPWYTRRIFAEAGFEPLETRYTLFFPGFLKALLPLEKHLAWCPLGAHYCSIARKAGRL